MTWWKIALGTMILALPASALRAARPDPPTESSMHKRQAGPLNIYSTGELDPSQWERISDDQQKENVEGLKKFAEKSISDAQVAMPLLETPHFLVYCDAGAKAAQEEASLLETSYTTLVNFFKLKASDNSKEKGQGANVWRGKALVFLFRDGNRYSKLMAMIHPPELDRYAVTLNGNGSVDIAIPGVSSEHDRRELLFAMMEGFIYRYRTPQSIEPWIADGVSTSLADTTPISGHVPSSGTLRERNGSRTLDALSIDYLKSHDVGDILSGSDDNQRSLIVCDSLATYMVRRDHYRYSSFISALKDGMDADKALKEKYGADRDHLKADYLNYLSRLR